MYLKVTNCKVEKISYRVLFILNSIVLAVIYASLNQYIYSVVLFTVLSVLNGIVLLSILKHNISHDLTVYLFSTLIAYVLYYFVLVISGFIIGIFMNGKQYDDIICVLIISLLYILMYKLFTSFKRVKNGFNFLKKTTINITYITVVFCVLALFFFGVIPRSNSSIIRRILLSLGSLVSILLFLLIKKLITKHYKRNMRDRAIAIQKEEIDANVKVIEELKEQNLKLSTTIHKYNHRLSALENSIRKVMDKSNTEFASELSIVLEQTKNVALQFADETKVKTELPSTNVVAIDNMLEYMRNEAVKHDIDFTLKLSDSIKPLLEKYISEDKFETLLADHIKDAIIAINAKNDGYKSIMVLIGAVQGAYELSIYDTGIEFDISTLLKLGIEPVTTHKDNGGSGLGFMTTFETIKSSKASLVIEEYDTGVTNYTKSVTIRFDGKCEYRIYSYRAEQIKNACSGRKIVIKNI